MAKELKSMAGSLQSDWTDTATLDPVSSWSSEILGEGIATSPFASLVQKGGQLRRNNKKTLFWQSKRIAVTSDVSTTWATGVGSVYSYEHSLDLDSLYIDPVEYRTNTPVAYESLDEVDMIPLAAYVKKSLVGYAQQKFTYHLYAALDDGPLDGSYDYDDVAGSALAYCNANTVDWGTQLTIDNFKSGVEEIVTDLYTPTDFLVPPALWGDLFAESQFTNAAQYGSQNTAITEGKLPRFMGVDIHLDNAMPDDNADADIGIMFDRNYFMGMVVAKDAKIAVHDRYETGEWDFTLAVKLGCKVTQENAGCAFYT